MFSSFHTHCPRPDRPCKVAINTKPTVACQGPFPWVQPFRPLIIATVFCYKLVHPYPVTRNVLVLLRRVQGCQNRGLSVELDTDLVGPCVVRTLARPPQVATNLLGRGPGADVRSVTPAHRPHARPHARTPVSRPRPR